MGATSNHARMIALAALLAPASVTAAPLPPLPGTWGVMIRIESVIQAPALPESQSSSLAWAIAELGVDEQGWYQTHRVCCAEVLGTGRLISSIVPASYTDHMPTKTMRPALGHDRHGGSWTVDMGEAAVGYHHHLSPDTLPDTADHPAVYDWDEDGKIGATVLIDLPLFQPFEIYIAQVSHLELQGRVISPEHIAGKILVHRQDRETLGASAALFDRDIPSHPLPGASTFSMVRVPDGTGCGQVRQAMESAPSPADTSANP